MSSAVARVAKWDNTKAILIFLVVFGHGITSYVQDSEIIRSTFIWITAFHMPLFMFLTGLFSKSFVRAPKFNSQKIASFVLLYFFMKLLIYVTLGVVRSWGTFRWTSEGGTPWYIFVTAVFLIVTRLLRNFNPKKVFVLTVAVALTVGYISEIGDDFMLSRIFVYYPYFFLGYLLDRDKLLGVVNKPWAKIVSVVVLVIFTAAVFYLGDSIYSIRYVLTGNNPYSEFGADWKPFGIFLRVGCYVASSAVGFSVLSLMPTKRIPIITKIGANTLTVYALHRPVLYVLQYTVMVPFMSDISANIMLLILFVGCAVLTYVLSLKPFSYVLWPCTNCHKWFAPIKKWLTK